MGSLVTVRRAFFVEDRIPTVVDNIGVNGLFVNTIGNNWDLNEVRRKGTPPNFVG
jgi:hypothetical protein